MYIAQKMVHAEEIEYSTNPRPEGAVAHLQEDFQVSFILQESPQPIGFYYCLRVRRSFQARLQHG